MKSLLQMVLNFGSPTLVLRGTRGLYLPGNFIYFINVMSHFPSFKDQYFHFNLKPLLQSRGASL